MARGLSLFNFGNYSFASWARRGIGNEIARNDNTLVRAEIPLGIKLNDEQLPEQKIELVGPADIAQITRSAIVRTEPLDRNYNAEWNFLPYIEFYDEDFLWRYTPDAPDANGNLCPWLALVVLKENEFRELPSRRGALQAIRLQTDVLPSATELHLWAHMHTGQHAGVTDLDKILVQIAENFPKDPDGFTCRLLSPRSLEQKTLYHAFLIPSFEAGRLAGLGDENFLKTPARQAAWADNNRPTNMDFPIYHRWAFATTDVDFEELISKMKATSANSNVGIRDMDTTQVGYVKADGKAPVSSISTPSVLGLEGALRTPATVSTPYKADGVTDDFQKDIAALLNLYDQASSTDTPQYAEAKMDGDPVLTIPLYGHPYATPKSIPLLPAPIQIKRDGKNWYSAVNFDPRNRVAASVGAQIVQQKQETFMQSAWIQLAYLQKARNNIAAVGSILKRMGDRLKNETLVPAEDFISIARGSLSRVRDTTKATTVLQQMTVSSLPNALLNSATRRLTGVNSKFMSRLAIKSPATTTSVLKQVSTNLTAANGSKLISIQSKFIRTSVSTPVVVAVVEAPQLNPTQQAFYPAYSQLMARIPSAPTQMPSIQMFDFIQAKQMVFTAIAAAPVRYYQAQILLPPAQATAITQPPAEVLGQPVFYDALYKPLWQLDKEWLLPNLHLIENNTITLLETNPSFINAYMLGANQELGREMLWREYPADLSTTFFRNFWDSTDGTYPPQSFDIEPIQKWLGKPAPTRQSLGSAAKLVLTLRGELLKKFPNTVIFMADLRRNARGELQPPAEGEGSSFLFPSFRADLPPDLQFMGFDISASEVLRADTDRPRAWYFIIMEPVGEARFGLDTDFRSNNPTTYSRNDLAWTHLKNPDLPPFITAQNKPKLATMPPAEKELWGKNAAEMAAFLFQQPFAVIIKAADLLKIKT